MGTRFHSRLVVSASSFSISRSSPCKSSPWARGFVAALKADTLSLATWQIGMYCLMAVLQFSVFERAFGGQPPVN